MNPKEHWQLITSKADVPQDEKVYVVCRSRSIAERWAIHQRIKQSDFHYATCLDTLKWYSKDINIFIISLRGDESSHWMDEVNRDKVKFKRVTMVVL